MGKFLNHEFLGDKINMEYDLDTFLDEYQPLFKSEHHKQNYMTRFEQLKKRYFSGKKMYIFIKRHLCYEKELTEKIKKNSKSVDTFHSSLRYHIWCESKTRQTWPNKDVTDWCLQAYYILIDFGLWYTFIFILFESQYKQTVIVYTV